MKNYLAQAKELAKVYREHIEKEMLFSQVDPQGFHIVAHSGGR
jgi:hypothetical protein